MELQTVYFTRDWRTGIKRWAGVYFWKLWCHHHLQKLLLLAWSSCQSSPMTWRQLLHGKGCLLIKLQNCSIKYLTGSYLPWKAATLLRNVKIIVIPVTVTHIVQQQQGSLYLEWLRFALCKIFCAVSVSFPLSLLRSHSLFPSFSHSLCSSVTHIPSVCIFLSLWFLFPVSISVCVFLSSSFLLYICLHPSLHLSCVMLRSVERSNPEVRVWCIVQVMHLCFGEL